MNGLETFPFDDDIGYFAEGPPEGWIPIRELSLLVLFGTTGVGKSTAVEALARTGLGYRWLPGRRELTRRLIVRPRLRAEGRPEATLARLQRYRYVRAFREEFASGMAVLLEGLAVRQGSESGLWVFDGLRGRGEARHALERLPEARYLVLTCPDFVRLTRLLDRQDPHDRASEGPQSRDVPESLLSSLTQEERSELEAALQSGRWSPEEVLTKLQILEQDRAIHDPAGARGLFEQAGDSQRRIFDTSRARPGVIARETARWLREAFPHDLQGGSES